LDQCRCGDAADRNRCDGAAGLVEAHRVAGHRIRPRRANPITYVTKDDPPFLIVHGDKDPLVPHNQSELLRDALKAVGVSVTFYTVQGGGHGGFKDPQVDPLVTEFFQKHVGKEIR